MECNTFTLLLLITLPTFIFRTTNGNQQTTLTDLTRFQVEGVVARFAVDREALEQVLQNRKQEDGFCGQGKHLTHKSETIREKRFYSMSFTHMIVENCFLSTPYTFLN